VYLRVLLRHFLLYPRSLSHDLVRCLDMLCRYEQVRHARTLGHF
jgi:hypothetical protein